MKKKITSIAALALCATAAMGQNPIIQTKYTADPAPLVVGDTLYLYTSHDNEEGDGYQMTDWQCFTTTDMQNWTDHGAVASLEDFSWTPDNGAWAQQVVYRNETYYMYAPIQLYGIGLLKSSSPYGPWKDPLGKALINQSISDIDPTVFIDDDNQAYIYWGNNALWYGLLPKSMQRITGDIVEIELTTEAFGGYKETYTDENGDEQTVTVGDDSYEEGPWFYKRGDIYYLVYAAGGVPEHLSYSISDSPTGPWTYQGIIMDTPEGSFTTHPGIAEFKGRNFIFYHSGQLDGGSGFRRSVCVEEFEYNDDGSIPYIEMTKGAITDPVDSLDPYVLQQAETIAYSKGVRTTKDSVTGSVFVDSLDHGDYIRVKSVDFGDSGASSVMLCVRDGVNAGNLQVCIDSQSNDVATLTVDGYDDWTEVTVDLEETVTGVHSIYFRFRAVDTTSDETESELMQFDYWQFYSAEVTGISEIAADDATDVKADDDAIYDLSGRRVTNPQNGLYIQNGKKIVF